MYGTGSARHNEVDRFNKHKPNAINQPATVQPPSAAIADPAGKVLQVDLDTDECECPYTALPRELEWYKKLVAQHPNLVSLNAHLDIIQLEARTHKPIKEVTIGAKQRTLEKQKREHEQEENAFGKIVYATQKTFDVTCKRFKFNWRSMIPNQLK